VSLPFTDQLQMCVTYVIFLKYIARWFAAARMLRLWLQISLTAWMLACCECFVLSGRGLCDELITRQEESYRLWCVVECDLETS